MRAPRTSAARALASTATSTSTALLIDSNTTLLLYEITVCFGGLGAKPPAFLAVLAWAVKSAGGEAAGPATNDAWAGSREPFWDGWSGEMAMLLGILSPAYGNMTSWVARLIRPMLLPL